MEVTHHACRECVGQCMHSCIVPARNVCTAKITSFHKLVREGGGEEEEVKWKRRDTGEKIEPEKERPEENSGSLSTR